MRTFPGRIKRQNGFAALILITAAIAIYVRWLYFIDTGGLYSSYFEWANPHYFGGIAGRYLNLAQSLLDDIFGRAQIQISDLPPMPPLVNVEHPECPGWASPAGPQGIIDYWGARAGVVYPPGYPIFLAALAVMGITRTQDMRVVQIVIDAVAILPLAFLLRRWGVSRSITLAAALFYALGPWWARGSTFLMGEALLSALVIGTLALLTWADGQRAPWCWVVVGLFCSLLPMFRADMILLIVPLALWAALRAPAKGRLVAIGSAVAGFAVLPAIWGFYNLAVHGRFIITSDSGWYALWSGLGMFPNDYGYFQNDVKGAVESHSHCIFGVGAAWDAFWRGKYLAALHDHPAYVLLAAAKRSFNIMFRPEIVVGPLDWSRYLGLLGPPATAAAVMLLVIRKRYSIALLVCAPIVYAVLSLGPVYAEERYVRYALISYVLAGVVLLETIRSASVVAVGHRTAIRALQVAGVVSIMVAFGIVLYGYLSLLIPPVRAAAIAAELSADRSGNPAPLHLDWKASDTGVEIHTTESGQILLQSSPGPTAYQLAAPLSTDGAPVIEIQLRADLKRGTMLLGALSADRSRWLNIVGIGTPGPNLYSLTTQTDDASQIILVIANNLTAPGTSILEIASVSARRLCLPPRGYFARMIGALNPLSFEPCPESQ
jgi:hypothetical protein